MARWFDEDGALSLPIRRWIHARACGAPGTSQFETIDVLRAIERPDGGVELELRYVFDRDGFSQYDRTETYTGRITLDAELQPIDGELTRAD